MFKEFSIPGSEFRPLTFRDQQDELIPKGLNYEV